MPGVVGNRRITDTVIPGRSRWSCKDGGAGQEAVGPGLTTVGGRRKPNVGSPTIKKAARLEGSNDRFAKGKGIGLDLCPVLTVRVVVRVTTELDK